jgi:HAE1 family hydrophobic/amphiphilic exporter-1
MGSRVLKMGSRKVANQIGAFPMIHSIRLATKASVLALLLLVTIGVAAQTPTPTPVNPATQPPGGEPSPTPPPTAPPGTQTQPITAPPGANVMPTPQPAPTETPGQEPRQPNFPSVQAQPVPPLPDLTRIGIVSSNIITLSLTDAIRKALQDNNDIEIARDDVKIAEYGLQSLYGVYDPVFSVTPTYDKRISPVTSIFAGGTASGTVSTTTYSLSPTLSKNFSTGGGNYTLGFANSKTVTSATSSTLNPFYSSNLSLSFTQPLWRNRSIDANRHSIRIQKKFIEQSDSDFRARTISIISQVQAAYWNLVFALRNQQNQLESLNVSRQNMRIIEAQIEAGAKAPLDRAQVQTDIASRETNLFIATQNVSVAENTLKQLMLHGPEAPEWTAQITPTDSPVLDIAPVNLPLALEEAHKNRPEIRRLNLQKEINTLDLQYYDNQTKPQINLTGTVATTGLAGTNILPACPPPTAGAPCVTTKYIGGYGQDLSNLFSGTTRNVNFGVSISFPFKNRTAEANLATARVQREQLEASFRSQDQAIEMDVRNAAQAVDTARRRVIASKAARESAEQQLAGEEKLYEVGRSTTFLLLERQNSLTAARTDELAAQTDYNKALADLQRATGSTLRVNNVVVQTPTTK